MALINLNNCFPLSENKGTRGPLPKQSEFLNLTLDPKGPKYLLYCGGIGSGKTLIGCITILTLAIMYPGDYLIARQFLPQLKDTTLKTFLEICPKELISEHRVADGIIKIKSRDGKISNILFRQLEEPDKLRSLNLSGFYIDESSQVSEAAFMLLQGRLRGSGLRKGILTTNPNGHDWQYSWFVKQDMFNSESAKKQFRLIKAPSTENVHLPDGYIETMLQTWSPERIKREIEGSFDAFEGMVYHEFRRDVHVVQPFVIPSEWTKIIGIDHGYRNPAAWVWGAVDYDDNIYIYREFYEREWLIEEIIKGRPKENKPGVLQLMKNEKISAAYIDPSTKAVRGTTGFSDYDTYIDHLPKTFPLMLANNDKTPGIDRVKSYLKVQSDTNKPRVFIFNTCVNLIDEMSKYRYAELGPNQQGRQNEKEEPVKVDDHALDAFRYLIMSRPEAPKKDADIWKKIKYDSLSGSVYRELQKLKNPTTNGDPWSGM
jgi:phage terminase large subunit